MSTENLEQLDDGKPAEESKQKASAAAESTGIEEESKDGFVIVDNSYLDSASEVHPLTNLSDFTRVNPVTAQTDFKHLNGMPSTFLIGP